MEKVILDNNQARFGINLNSEIKKIFYYFIQKDESIGVGNYFTGNKTARSHFGKDEKWEVSVSEAKKKTKEFAIQKTSFHKSGIQVSKDNEGMRFSGDSDPASIPFGEIKDPVQLRVIYPSSMKSYPISKANEKINVHKITNENPQMIKIFLSPRNYNFEKWILGIDSSARIFQDITSLKDFGLYIYVVYRGSNNAFIPEAHLEADTIF